MNARTYFFCKKHELPCVMALEKGNCSVRECGYEPRLKTNADHIRSMTDEELAEFLGDATYKENEQGYPLMRTVNTVWWHKWLKQPYKEES